MNDVANRSDTFNNRLHLIRNEEARTCDGGLPILLLMRWRDTRLDEVGISWKREMALARVNHLDRHKLFQQACVGIAQQAVELGVDRPVAADLMSDIGHAHEQAVGGTNAIQHIIAACLEMAEAPPSEPKGNGGPPELPPWEPPAWEPSDRPPEAETPQKAPTTGFKIVPYAWPDPASILRRKFLYGTHYMRGTVSGSIGAGGRLKTTNELIEMIGMACGKNLLTGEDLPEGPMHVLHLNGEEDQDELDRRVAAICQLFDVSKEKCGDRLHIMSVRDTPMCFAIMKGNAASLELDVLGKLEAQMREWKIDVLTIDPLISFHRVREGDNGDMDLLIKRGLGDIARRTKSAIDICHHPGKAKPGQSDATVEDARGASAFLWAVRSARVLNFMTPEEAKKLGIGEKERRHHVRIANGKANNAPLGAADWIKITLVTIASGEEVAAASSWAPPNPFDGMTVGDVEWVRGLTKTGEYRRDARSPQWIGFALALHLKIPLGRDRTKKKLPIIEDPKDAARVKLILQTWLKNGVIAIEKRKDTDGKEREFIVPGPTQPDVVSTSADEEF